MPKYVFVCGALISGLGKGIVTSSVGRNLQIRGKKINVIKIDPYLNIDAGTMNPFEHGETYVTADGAELDVDFGHYERMLDLEMKAEQNITTGQVYLSVIEAERRGDFLGKTVQVIPHITDEIKARIKKVAENNKDIDVLIIEVGGTIGDIESQPFLEAIRQLRRETPKEDTALILLTYVMKPPNLKELKTKPTQHAVRELQSMGLTPDIIIARGEQDLTEEAKEKIVMFCDVPANAVFSLPDLDTVLRAPIYLDKQGFGSTLNWILSYENVKANWMEDEKIIDKLLNAENEVTIAIIGKYTRLADSYISIKEALKHAGIANNTKVNVEFISSERFEGKEKPFHELLKYDGILVPGGFGSRGVEGKINIIRFARENKIPFLGVCFGFQLSVVEFARNVCNMEKAHTTEVDEKTPYPVIDLLPEQHDIHEKGGTMRLGAHRVLLERDTTFHSMYNADFCIERHRHRYEVNPQFIQDLEKHGLHFSGKSEDGRRMETLEYKDNPNFIATQFHPEFNSKPKKPSPPYNYFISRVLKNKQL